MTTRWRETDPDASGLPHVSPPVVDPDASGLHGLDVRIEALERQVRELQSRFGRWGQNGLAIADETDVFAGAGGNYGDGVRFARDDHGH